MVAADDEFSPLLAEEGHSHAPPTKSVAGGRLKHDPTEAESFSRQRGQQKIGETLLSGATSFAGGFALTSIFGCLTLANVMDAWPVSLYFLLTWSGHGVAVLFHVQALLELRRFLQRPPRERGVKMMSRRERIPFAKAVLGLSVQVAAFTALFLTFEILLYNHLRGHVNCAAVVAPIWIGCTVLLVQGVMCRFASTGMMWDAVLVVIFCYALVHKVDDGAKVPWTIVFIPVLLILLEYVLQLLYWMLRDVAGPVILSPLQRKCTVQYVSGLIVLLVALVLVAMDLDNVANSAGKSMGTRSGTSGEDSEAANQIWLTSAAILIVFSEALLFSAIYQIAANEVEHYSRFVGEEVPLQLAKYEYGWDVAHDSRSVLVASIPMILGHHPGPSASAIDKVNAHKPPPVTQHVPARPTAKQ